ncbi:hypothetical protein G6F56_007309 [Rhizopus delemar]|uniref:Lipocalin-like domain-containing protein n=1 Tax=Rhizopus stolonifer TaxID=4846 RepID=A0A367KQ37_RHIST|nr:hypothetical protein G6F56_007309 [Rhizopus delemar]RCI04299.1 hypothetical protein CU098_012811 [Rhizopus stolonifer]
MKFSIKKLTATLFTIATVSGAALHERQNTESQYPASTDIGTLNGTWYLTGLTSNVWDAYESISRTLGISANCIKLNLSSSSNSTLEAIGSAHLNRTNTGTGLEASAAGVFYLQPPSDGLAQGDLTWTAYVSQVFVNSAQWQNFVSNGQSNVADNGTSQAVPGSQPSQVTINTHLIHNDTLFVWGSQANTTEIYGAIVSKTSTVSQDTFNQTLSSLPTEVNNTTLLLLKDSCT